MIVNQIFRFLKISKIYKFIIKLLYLLNIIKLLDFTIILSKIKKIVTNEDRKGQFLLIYLQLIYIVILDECEDKYLKLNEKSVIYRDPHYIIN